MKKTIELSEKQYSVVYAENGPLYVKASAGSGKTRVLTERLRHLLSKTKKKVLALTFTNKAGAEIKQRLNEIDDIESRAFIGTFHGFCQSILESHGNLLGFSGMPHIFEDNADRMELIEQAIEEIPTYALKYVEKNEKEKRDFKFKALSFISKVKRDLIDDEDFENHTDNQNLILLYKSYQGILRSQNALDFDDILLYAFKLLTDFPKLSSMYRRSFYAICVDEAQDLNNAQYQVLKVIADDGFDNIMLVGDPNQSIFHFNGSSAKYMNELFVDDYQPAIVELNENFRSSKRVLEAAQKIVPEAEHVENVVKEGIFELKCFNNEFDEASWIANKIHELIQLKKHEDIEGSITAERIAILARNKYLFKSLENELSNLTLDFYYKMTPGAVKFESSAMKVFDMALRVRLNPKDKLHKTKLSHALGTTNETLDAAEDIAVLTDRNDLKSAIDLAYNLNEEGKNLKQLIRAIKEDLELADEDEKAMLFNDLDELEKHWINYAKNSNSTSLLQFKNSMALGQTHPLAQHSGITLSTIHTMKGQEFDIVFVLGTDDETFPDYRAVRAGGIEIEQEKNNMYVAFTRSKRWLYVTWPSSRTMPWGDVRRRRVSRFLTDF
ncbi:DNA helicase-2/ATP-dependent DNA helicase PcrA [Onishia taeanensis]|uniref:DNA 3'-5' helicase n=1 Tax=Onishia taeanensis TaxID=284577 RepID=A0A328XS16_9GAMM|nr:ATP-dependent helicase [Halomonas taeanensis]RAR59796.1 DNA helicase-2/ATP-dependent DNA helicase PcrA [Halomonas taeanensis]